MKKQLINLEPVKAQVREKLIEKYNSTIFMNTDTVDIRVDIKEILEEYISSKNLTEPTIYITTEAYCKMRKLVDDTATEIGWYGTVTKMPGLDSVYIIEDILVYPQKVTGATCEQDDDRMFEFEMSLTTEQVNMKRFQGHSHVNMGVTPSGVDEQFYQDLLTQVTDYFIITVTNKHGAYTTRFYDIENNILYSDVPIKILLGNGTDLEKWYEEAEDKLDEPKPVLNYTSSYKSNSSNILNQTGKVYTAADQAKRFQNPYDDYDYDEDDQMVWDERFGYITKAEQKAWNKTYVTKSTVKRGRPRKGK